MLCRAAPPLPLTRCPSTTTSPRPATLSNADYVPQWTDTLPGNLALTRDGETDSLTFGYEYPFLLVPGQAVLVPLKPITYVRIGPKVVRMITDRI